MASVRVRIGVIQVAFVLGLALILARAAQVQLLEGAEHAARAEAQRTDRVTLPARRGTIYDRNGVILAHSQQVHHVGVAANELCPGRARGCDEAAKIKRIATQVGVSSREVRRALRDGYAYFHGPFTSAQVEPIRGMRGVHLTSELVRFHPDPDFARPWLGRPAADGRPTGGIERVLDSVLTGRDGRAVVLRDPRGRRYESPSRLDLFPEPGHDVYLTLDAELQEIIDQALTEAVGRYRADGGDAVVLNPETGEILAVASRDADGSSTTGAFTSVFEPGSTAKVFAAAALLEHEKARPTDSVWAEHGTYRTPVRVIEDEHPAGWLTLRQVIERSSNIGIAKLATELSPVEQYTMLRAFGVGSPTAVEYPAESPGILRRPSRWSGTTAASLAIGYELAVTPIQLVQAYAAIANGGVMYRPTLVREIRAADGRVVYRHRPEPVRRVVSKGTASELREMLRGVVYRDGTGATAALSTHEVAGKTGTAKRAGPRGYIPGSHTASFVSLFPAEDPQLVMVIKLDDPAGSYGALTAAPVTRQVLEHLLAARSAVLDRQRLATGATGPLEQPPAIGAGTVPYVVAWPPPPAAKPIAATRVPDVRGLSLRDAARRLHAAGLRVQLDGWGTVRATSPRGGGDVPPGTLVTVTGGASVTGR